MLTIEEKNAVASMKVSANKFISGVRVLVEMNAMIAENMKRVSAGVSPAYDENSFTQLLENLDI